MHNAHEISVADLLIILNFLFSSIFEIDGKQRLKKHKTIDM